MMTGETAGPTTAVAMSGGVDSSVAACLLARERRPLVGFSMQLVDRLAGETERYGRCCSPDDFRDARSVADRLGFPHYVLDMEREFHEAVLQPFADDYAAGRTPSPCVRCNTYLKFGTLLSRARAVGGELVLILPSPPVRSILELTRIHRSVEIVDDERAAYATLTALPLDVEHAA